MLRSSIGKKFIVAITGVVLFGFVILHMLGNLKAFMGVDPESGMYKLDHYARFLRTVGHEMVGNYSVLWGTRVVLLVALVLHVAIAVSLQLEARASRPVPYVNRMYGACTYAARSMLWSGLLLLLFIVLHILHFTTGTLHFQGFQEGMVFANVVRAFSVWPVAAVYIVAMMALAFHLYHGVWSFFQTLGLDSSGCNPKLRRFASLSAIVLFLGFIAVPVGVLAGVLNLGGR